MTIESVQLRVLAVDCRVSGGDATIGVTETHSAAETLAAIRVEPFDCWVSGREVNGEPVWPLADKIRRVRPKLRWWLIARGIDAPDEIRARSMGVMRILADAPTPADLLAAFGRTGCPDGLPVMREIAEIPPLGGSIPQGGTPPGSIVTDGGAGFELVDPPPDAGSLRPA